MASLAWEDFRLRRSVGSVAVLAEDDAPFERGRQRAGLDHRSDLSPVE